MTSSFSELVFRVGTVQDLAALRAFMTAEQGWTEHDLPPWHGLPQSLHQGKTILAMSEGRIVGALTFRTRTVAPKGFKVQVAFVANVRRAREEPVILDGMLDLAAVRAWQLECAAIAARLTSATDVERLGGWTVVDAEQFRIMRSDVKLLLSKIGCNKVALRSGSDVCFLYRTRPTAE